MMLIEYVTDDGTRSSKNAYSLQLDSHKQQELKKIRCDKGVRRLNIVKDLQVTIGDNVDRLEMWRNKSVAINN